LPSRGDASERTLAQTPDRTSAVSQILSEATSHYRQLDESKIAATLTALRDRIEAQFPDSGLGKVADELIAVASEVTECADYLNSRNWPIRIFAAALIAGMIVVLYLASPPLDLPAGAHKFSGVQSIAAVLNSV